MKTFFLSARNYFSLFFLVFINLACMYTGKNINQRVQENANFLNGLDALEKKEFQDLKGKRIGLVTNQTGVNKNLTQNIKLFANSDNVQLKAIYTPEHGLYGSIPAGEKISSSKNKIFDVPIYSLYGVTKKPTPEMLRDIDLIIYDIQDIGIRSYTYISTMGLAMEAAAENNIEFMVLDRPNPLGLKKIEGNILKKDFSSFIGKYPIPYVYGLSCGELARFINESGWLGPQKCKLTVVKMENNHRHQVPKILDKNWVPTSPHVPSPNTPAYMVATGILGELGVFSIGVGYTLPFKTIAAPWIDSELITTELNALGLKGVIFRPIQYSPYYGIYKGQQVKGVEIFISDKNLVKLITIQFYFLEVHNKLYPQKNPFEIATKEQLKMFDKALGTDTIRKAFSGSFKTSDVLSSLVPDLKDYRAKVKDYYIYD